MSSSEDKLQTIYDALDLLATAIKDATSEDRTMTEMYGWNFPPLGRTDLSRMVTVVRDKVSSIDPARLSDKYDPSPLKSRIDTTRITIVPYLFNGNGNNAVPSLLGLLQLIDQHFRSLFEPRLDWDTLDKAGAVPKKMAARVRSLAANINTLTTKTGKLDEQIAVINNAHAAAEALPTDMESLDEARQRIAQLEAESSRMVAVIELQRAEIEKALHGVKEAEKEAAILVKNCGDAYSAATTKGLGESFQNRADSLSTSMWIWVGGLILALGIGAFLGTRRVEMIQTLVEQQKGAGSLGVYIALALFSIAAPVWFSWIATKQIGQRFRLAEDYGFKASVAKAYEGYRREAAKLDESFSQRLFGTALDRIDEPPLRFVETENHGSPLHELLSRKRPGADRPRVEKATAAEQSVAQDEEED